MKMRVSSGKYDTRTSTFSTLVRDYSITKIHRNIYGYIYEKPEACRGPRLVRQLFPEGPGRAPRAHAVPSALAHQQRTAGYSRRRLPRGYRSDSSCRSAQEITPRRYLNNIQIREPRSGRPAVTLHSTYKSLDQFQIVALGIRPLVTRDAY